MDLNLIELLQYNNHITSNTRYYIAVSIGYRVLLMIQVLIGICMCALKNKHYHDKESDSFIPNSKLY